jgi:hypothetical protein
VLSPPLHVKHDLLPDSTDDDQASVIRPPDASTNALYLDHAIPQAT